MSKLTRDHILYSVAAFLVFGLLFVFFFAQMKIPWLYVVAQILYLLTFMVTFYFLTRKVNWVNPDDVKTLTPGQMPLILLAYPVLHEDEKTMQTTMTALGMLDYPKDKYKVIAIPNSHDDETIATLRRLQQQFGFLEILEIPPTSDSSWDVVWKAWDSNGKSYWWHEGRTKHDWELPAKKTRQLIYFFYTMVARHGTDWVLDYIDADSITPPSHFKLAAAGLQKYDVLQSTNVVGNLLDTPSTALHAFDHMTWDGMIYPHMSDNGNHPYYVLGKGLFYKSKDLYDCGGFNPWITIEDPEVGIRLWKNGKKLGIIEEPLIEEVPQTIITGGFIQRTRWMCGFFQTMSSPLKAMGLSFWQRQKARLNLGPVMSLPVNIIGIPTGAYALYIMITSKGYFPLWVIILSIVNAIFYIGLMTAIYRVIWKRTRYVLDRKRDRLDYMLDVNPIMLFFYWVLWTIPILGGFFMFVTNQGKSWARTEKVDADRHLVARANA